MDRKRQGRSRVLIIGPTPPPYHGVAVSTQTILQGSAFRRFRLLHLDTSDRRSRSNIGKFEAGNVALALLHLDRFLALLLQQRPQLIYLPISQGQAGYLRDALFLLPARWLAIPAVVHLRGSEFRAFYKAAAPPLQWLIRYSLGRVRRVVVLGEALTGLFAGLVPPERLVVVPNGTPDFFAPALRDKSSGSLLGVFMSSLRARKGLFIALAAAIEAAGCFPNLEFAFAGEWQSVAVREQAESLLRKSAVADRIRFVGVVTGEDKHKLLANADFFIFPPIEPEGHPRVVIESMAAALPIITTDQGAIAETVVDGVTGFLVPPNDSAAIAEKIAVLLQDTGARQRMGQAARRRYLELYTDDKSNRSLAAVFDAVLAEAASARTAQAKSDAIKADTLPARRRMESK